MTRDGRNVRAALAAALATGVLAAAGCGDDDDDSGDAAGTVDAVEMAPPTSTTDAPDTACEDVPAAEPKTAKVGKPKGDEVKPGEKITAKVETNCGDFEIALDTKGSPKTTGSFVHMVDEGLYDGTPFHRVVAGFVIQGGDPSGDGTGGPGYGVVEPPPEDTAYTKGVVAMAKAPTEPAGASGSQFFVVTGADAGLPPDYAILGELAGSDKAVKNIESVASGGDGPPTVPVVIEKITLERG